MDSMTRRGLLNSSFHIKILDEFAKNNTLLKDLEKTYKELKETENKIAEIKLKKESAEKEKDYLNYIINELKSANLKEGEEENLSRKKDQLQGKEKIINFLSELKSNLLESNSHLLLSQKILIRNQNIINNYLPLEKENLEDLSVKIDEQNGEIEKILLKVESLEREVNSTDESFEEIEERLFYIKSLARKFNTTSDNLPQIIDDAKEKLSLLQNEEIFTAKLDEQRKNLISEYFKIADKLNEKRKKSAILLAKKVEEELKFLKMDGVKFLVEISEEKDDSNYRMSGYNKVRFLASINKNDFDDIAKIASGGELSRFMLALKVALIDVKSCPSLIFDEIDSGIGGSTADAVGKRLKEIAKNLQVLVVTHQPQIAAKADNHFKVSKISNDSKTKTIIEKLDDKNRELEIARMLSGEKITNEALAAANRLIY